MTERTIKFTQGTDGLYMEGDERSFPANIAECYVWRGVAVYADKEPFADDPPPNKQMKTAKVARK